MQLEALAARAVVVRVRDAGVAGLPIDSARSGAYGRVVLLVHGAGPWLGRDRGWPTPRARTDGWGRWHVRPSRWPGRSWPSRSRRWAELPGFR